MAARSTRPWKSRKRHITLEGQQYVAGDRTRPLFNVHFCRDCGNLTRLVVSAMEAGGTSMDDYRRLVSDYREKVIEKL